MTGLKRDGLDLFVALCADGSYDTPTCKELWVRYRRATTGGPLSNWLSCWKLNPDMAAESTPRKDSLRVEKLSLLVLTLCIVVLVYLVVFRPF